jgi:hypothetical protein
MADKNIAVFGIYSTRIDVERASDALNTAGFPAVDISVLMPSSLSDSAADDDTLIVIPEVGSLVATGPIVASLAEPGVGGAVRGIADALVEMGLPDYEAKRYAEHVQDGAIMLSVRCDTPGEVLRAKEVVSGSGAEHVLSSGESMVETMSMPASQSQGQGQAYK